MSKFIEKKEGVDSQYLEDQNDNEIQNYRRNEILKHIYPMSILDVADLISVSRPFLNMKLRGQRWIWPEDVKKIKEIDVQLFFKCYPDKKARAEERVRKTITEYYLAWEYREKYM